MVGRFVELVELVPHRRLVFTYGWEDGRLGVPPESTTVEIDLCRDRRHHHPAPGPPRPPPETVPDHQHGWSYFLNALRDTLSAG